MPGSLKEFIASRAGQIESETRAARAEHDDWVAAVAHLMERIQGWVADADPTGTLLTAQSAPFTPDDPRIGRYYTKSLTIAFGPKKVEIQPRERFVRGPYSLDGALVVPRNYGQVNMTNGLEWYLLFRDRREPEDHWVIVDQDGEHMQPFEQASFESALQSLLE